MPRWPALNRRVVMGADLHAEPCGRRRALDRTLGQNLDGEGDDGMAWTWRYEGEDGRRDAGESEPFPSQADAESWLGQNWRELVAGEVVTAVLVEDDRVESRISLPRAAK